MLLGDGDIHATDARQHLGHFDQFVIVGGEERACATAFVVVQVFNDGAGDGYTIMRDGTFTI